MDLGLQISVLRGYMPLHSGCYIYSVLGVRGRERRTALNRFAFAEREKLL